MAKQFYLCYTIETIKYIVGCVLTTELTNEQIVTNLLVSDEILRPVKNISHPNSHRSLGKYLSNVLKKQKEPQKHQRYIFIDLDNKWKF